MKVNLTKYHVRIKCCILLISLVLTGSIAAQKAFEDVIYLKNGGIIRGAIKTILPDSSIKIETIGRNIFVFKAAEIDKLIKEEVMPVNSFLSKKKGFSNLNSMGIIQ